MTTLGEIVLIAQDLLEQLGPRAEDVARLRAETFGRDGDEEMASFWIRIALAVAHLRKDGAEDQKLAPAQSVPGRALDSEPGARLLLAPDLKIVDASRAYLDATMTSKAAILGCHVFDVFPDNPGDPTARGVSLATASFMRVLENGAPDRIDLRYDIRNGEGRFEEHWWKSVNAPILDAGGRPSFILHQTADITNSRNRARAVH